MIHGQQNATISGRAERDERGIISAPNGSYPRMTHNQAAWPGQEPPGARRGIIKGEPSVRQVGRPG